MLRTWRQRITITDIFIWLIGLSIAGLVIWGTISTLQQGQYSASVWLDLTIKGLALGGVYALIAMGYTMVYGILKMINFAHSEVFMSWTLHGGFCCPRACPNPVFLNRQPVIGLGYHLVGFRGCLDPDRDPPGKDLLPAFAKCAPPGSPHHRHRGFFFSPVCIPRLVRFRHIWLS